MTYSAMYGGRSGRAKGKAPKSKKLKCILCQAKGHDAASCPQIKDDDDHQKKEQVLKATLMQPTLGFGKTHKTSRKAGTILNAAIGSSHNNVDDDNENNNQTDNIFDMFREINDVSYHNSSNIHYEPLIILDGGCDIGATLDHIATTITNSNLKKAKITYQNTIATTATTSSSQQQQQQQPEQESSTTENNVVQYGASICRFLIKPDQINSKKPLMNNPRIMTILETNPHTYFVVGLGPGFFMNGNLNDDHNSDMHSVASDDYKDAFDSLLEAITENDNVATENNNHTDDNTLRCPTNHRIVGLYGKLDYSPEMTDMIGYDTTTQLNKLRVTCQVAIQCQLPIQIKISPSAVPPNYMNITSPAADRDIKIPEEFEESILHQAEAYKQVVKDLARVLLEMTPSTTSENATESNRGLLRVHLSSWSGTEMHMNHLLQAFPHNVYIGLNATIGYTKHKHLHECTFAIPMDRCILESDAPNAIPSQLHNKKKIFCHSGCILYTAVSVAEHKRQVVSPIDVLRTTTQNAMQLYGGSNDTTKNGLAMRIEEVIRHAREQIKERMVLQQQIQDDANMNDDEQRNRNTPDAVTGSSTLSLSSQKMTKKKTKTRKNGNPVDTNNNNIVNDDDELLAELVSEMMTDQEVTTM